MIAPSDFHVPGAHPIDCRGVRLWLLPQRAIWWPDRRALLVADVHFGKAASFRRAGQPVPGGTTDDNLRRLDQLIGLCDARQLIVLGDFLHDRVAQQASTMDKLLAWRARQGRLDCVVVGGNHDRHAGDLQADLRITQVTDPWLLDPFLLRHHPQAQTHGYVLAGHVHPAYRLHGVARDRLRLPCFVFGAQVAILPAFGEFTGHATVAPGVDQAIYVIGDQRVWPVPTRRANGGGMPVPR